MPWRGGAALGLAAVAVCMSLLGGCARQPPVRFSKVGATQELFMQQRYVCIQQSQQNRAAANNYGAYAEVIVNRGVFMSCMGAQGYQFDPNGHLTALPGTEIRMVD
jgi:hypothetical protein